jgi:P4 family phage/plasmid primase-like protien
LLQALGEKTMLYEGDVLTYSEATGVWEVRTESELLAALTSFAGCPVVAPKPHQLRLSHAQVKGALQIVRARLAASHSYERLRAVPGGCFTNTFVTVDGGELTLDDHEYQQFARYTFPFAYEPLEENARLLEFFDAVFADATVEDRRDQVRLLQEFLGTCLIGQATRHQRCLILVGTGANGKSAFLDIARAIFPAGSFASVPPQQWGDRFRTASLRNIVANFVDEIPENEIVAHDVFKSVITGEAVQAEKKYGDPFNFRPRAGHIFSANTLPASSDHSDGFWRRIMIVPFTRNMEAAAEHRREIAEYVVAGGHGAIVAWALEGARRVQEQGGYTIPGSSCRLTSQWRSETDSVRLFLQTECTQNPGAMTSSQTLYRAYNAWAARNGFRPVSITRFGRQAAAAGSRSQHGQHGNFYRVTLVHEPYGIC